MAEQEISFGFDASRIDAIFEPFDQCRLPGAAVGIAVNGRVLYRKGFGLANMELPVVLSPTIRMRIGSTTKQFTAFTYMMLCEEGRAGIDDPLGKHLPELHPVTRKVTMRQLMTNTSGLRDPYEMVAQFSGMAPHVTDADLLAFYRDMGDVNAPPGARWIYNNGNWLLLSAAIERITGQPLEEAMWQRVFAPIGMYETMLRRRDTSFVPNSATPHSINAAGGFDKAYWVEFTGAGGMVSTINDMLRWLAHMDAPVVGSRAAWELMKTPHRLPNGGSTLYGLGLIRDRYRGVETLHHAGNWVGGNAQMLKVPAAGLDIVVIVNRNDVWSVLLVREVLDACLTGLAPVAKPGTGSAVSGLFRSPSTHRVIHATTRDGQQIISLNGHEMPVAPDEAGVLRPFGLMDYVKQGVRVVGDPQSPTALQLDDYGGTDEFIPVPGEAVSDTRECVGRYRSESTGTQASVAQTPEGLMIQMTGRFGAMVYRLEPLDAGIWRATTARRTPPGVAFVTFERDGTAFRYSTWQTWSLPFRRCT